jgi:hypothetical protein
MAKTKNRRKPADPVHPLSYLSLDDVRGLMLHHPLPERHDPPFWRPIGVGLNTALFHVEGPIVYARETTAAWLAQELGEDTCVHAFSVDRGHTVVFDLARFPTVIRVCLLKGRQVLIV